MGNHHSVNKLWGERECVGGNILCIDILAFLAEELGCSDCNDCNDNV